MILFAINQKRQTKDGKLHAIVTEISEGGRYGVLIITDENGIEYQHSGEAREFQMFGSWQLCS
jgi:hypothetical protein